MPTDRKDEMPTRQDQAIEQVAAIIYENGLTPTEAADVNGREGGRLPQPEGGVMARHIPVILVDVDANGFDGTYWAARRAVTVTIKHHQNALKAIARRKGRTAATTKAVRSHEYALTHLVALRDALVAARKLALVPSEPHVIDVETDEDLGIATPDMFAGWQAIKFLHNERPVMLLDGDGDPVTRDWADRHPDALVRLVYIR